LYQVWLKLACWFWKRRILKIFPNTIITQGWFVPSLNETWKDFWKISVYFY
jgi:hypothetical protein